MPSSRHPILAVELQQLLLLHSILFLIPAVLPCLVQACLVFAAETQKFAWRGLFVVTLGLEARNKRSLLIIEDSAGEVML